MEYEMLIKLIKEHKMTVEIVYGGKFLTDGWY